MTEVVVENKTIDLLKKNFADDILETQDRSGLNDSFAIVEKENIVEILKFLRDHKDLKFNFLMDVTAVDYLKHPVKRKKRFEVVYQLYSLSNKQRFRIKAPINPKEDIDSCHELWASADWGERETYDMYGIIFKNHPNLKRILTHADFVGHPLRKDYPTKKRQTLSINDSLMDEMNQKLKEKGLK